MPYNVANIRTAPSAYYQDNVFIFPGQAHSRRSWQNTYYNKPFYPNFGKYIAYNTTSAAYGRFPAYEYGCAAK